MQHILLLLLIGLLRSQQFYSIANPVPSPTLYTGDLFKINLDSHYAGESLGFRLAESLEGKAVLNDRFLEESKFTHKLPFSNINFVRRSSRSDSFFVVHNNINIALITLDQEGRVISIPSKRRLNFENVYIEGIGDGPFKKLVCLDLTEYQGVVYTLCCDIKQENQKKEKEFVIFTIMNIFDDFSTPIIKMNKNLMLANTEEAIPKRLKIKHWPIPNKMGKIIVYFSDSLKNMGAAKIIDLLNDGSLSYLSASYQYSTLKFLDHEVFKRIQVNEDGKKISIFENFIFRDAFFHYSKMYLVGYNSKTPINTKETTIQEVNILLFESSDDFKSNIIFKDSSRLVFPVFRKDFANGLAIKIDFGFENDQVIAISKKSAIRGNIFFKNDLISIDIILQYPLDSGIASDDYELELDDAEMFTVPSIASVNNANVIFFAKITRITDYSRDIGFVYLSTEFGKPIISKDSTIINLLLNQNALISIDGNLLLTYKKIINSRILEINASNLLNGETKIKLLISKEDKHIGDSSLETITVTKQSKAGQNIQFNPLIREVTGYRNGWIKLPISAQSLIATNPVIKVKNLPTAAWKVNSLNTVKMKVEYSGDKEFDTAIPMGSKALILTNANIFEDRDFLVFICNPDLDLEMPKCKRMQGVEERFASGEYIIGFVEMGNEIIILRGIINQNNLSFVTLIDQETGIVNKMTLSTKIIKFVAYDDDSHGYLSYIDSKGNIWTVEYFINNGKTKFSTQKKHHIPPDLCIKDIFSSDKDSRVIAKSDCGNITELISIQLEETQEQKKMKRTDIGKSGLLICPISNEVIIYDYSRKALYAIDLMSKSRYTFPVLEFGLSTIENFYCVEKQNKVILTGKQIESQDKILMVVLNGGSSQNIGNRIHSVRESGSASSEFYIGLDLERRITLIMPETTKISSSSNEIEIIKLLEWGPNIYLNSKELKNGEPNEISVEVATTSNSVSQNFTVYVLNELNQPSVRFNDDINPEFKAGEVIDLEKLIEIDGPVMNVHLNANLAASAKLLERKELINQLNTFDSLPIDYIEIIGQWMVIFKKNSMIRIDKRNALTSKNSPIFQRRFSNNYLSVVTVEDKNLTRITILTKHFSSFTDTNPTLYLEIITSEPSNSFIELVTFQFAWDTISSEYRALRISPTKMIVVELLTEKGGFAFTYFEYKNNKWIIEQDPFSNTIKRKDPALISIGNDSIFDFTVTSFDNGMITVIFSTIESIEIGIITISDGTSPVLYPMLKGGEDKQDILIGSLECTILDPKNSVDCIVDSTSVNAYNMIYTLDWDKTPGQKKISQIKRANYMFKPSGYKATKIEKTDRFIAIKYDLSNTYSSQTNEANDSHSCKNLLMIYKKGQAYPWAGFSCTDFNQINSTRSGVIDYSLTHINGRDTICHSVLGLSGTSNSSIKCYYLNNLTLSVTSEGFVATDLKIEYVGYTSKTEAKSTANFNELLQRPYYKNLAPQVSPPKSRVPLLLLIGAVVFVVLILGVAAIFILFRISKKKVLAESQGYEEEIVLEEDSTASLI